MLEIDGPWGHSAFLNSDRTLAPELGLRIARHVESAGMRPLAIRRPGRDRGDGRWRWAIVDSRVGSESIRWGEVASPEEVFEIPLDGSSGTASDAPVVAVCTHGKHDTCCAVRGRRVIPALTKHYSDVTWECSHLGGDRFAGTMIVFPHGLYYGNVDEADVASIVDAYREGSVDPRFLRGRSSVSAEVQVAQHHARIALGTNTLDTLHPLSSTQDNELWTVVLRHDRSSVTVVLEQGSSRPIATTCSAVRTGSVRTFDLVSVEVG